MLLNVNFILTSIFEKVMLLFLLTNQADKGEKMNY